MPLRWSEIKQRIQVHNNCERDCLDKVVAYRTGQSSTKGDFALRLSRGEEAAKWWQLLQRSKQPQNQEEPDNMKGGKK
jgi:CO/xanthine dehydrogenase Mo-binding subunit